MSDVLGIGANGFNPQQLFVTAEQRSLQMESLANTALSQGIDHYQNGRFADAAAAFQRSVTLAPASANAMEAANYMASSYIKLGRSDKAVEAYRLAIRLNPASDEPRVKLGHMFYADGRYREAEREYAEAVRVNPNSVNRYSLGQAHLALGDYISAARRFSEVARLEPDAPNGYYGLGLTYSRWDRRDEAVDAFRTAIAKDETFHTARLDLGMTYADLGRMEEAEEVLAFLEDADPDLADTLSRYLYQVDPPKFMFASAEGSFPYTLPARTPLAALDAYLAAAGARQSFSMVFQFDKEMDRESVENIYNWEIARAAGSGPGEMYNFGLPLPATEVAPPQYPAYVYYDAQNLTATVRFTLTQNATADGTIDPSHIAFRFKGEDRFGNAMSPKHDQFSGFSRIA
jgi:tetratricopeptide (TPR) repeat protein